MHIRNGFYVCITNIGAVRGVSDASKPGTGRQLVVFFSGGDLMHAWARSEIQRWYGRMEHSSRWEGSKTSISL